LRAARADPRSAYALIYERNFQQPLYDAQVADVKPPPPKPAVTLVGTVIESALEG
jgi:hypothetical protein